MTRPARAPEIHRRDDVRRRSEHRPPVDSARGGGHSVPPERPRLRVVRRPARAPRPARSLPLGTRGTRARRTVRGRAGAGRPRRRVRPRRRRDRGGRWAGAGRLRLFRYEIQPLALRCRPGCRRGGREPSAAERERRRCPSRARARSLPSQPRSKVGTSSRPARWEFELHQYVVDRSGRADVGSIAPPAGGRAPGWHAGIVAANRDVSLGFGVPRPARAATRRRSPTPRSAPAAPTPARTAPWLSPASSASGRSRSTAASTSSRSKRPSSRPSRSLVARVGRRRIARRYLPVRTPWASGDQTICEMPFRRAERDQLASRACARAANTAAGSTRTARRPARASAASDLLRGHSEKPR